MSDPVRRLVERRIGLDPDTLGPTAFALAVADRGRATRLTDPAAYTALLERDPAEFQALADRLVVPETWFFRGGPLFHHLARFAAERIAAGRGFRALSLPCSSGEEPYSLAVALADAGLPADRWAIDGFDLSPAAVAAAGRGVYREFSFRQTPADVRTRHFREVPGGWELSPAVRAGVRVRVGNGLDPDLGAGEAGYDVILCRNLLIYLTSDARRRLLDNLSRRLVAGGWLGVGHAEPSALAGHGFGQEGPTELFLFRRTGAAERSSDSDRVGPAKPGLPPPPSTAGTARELAATPVPKPTAAVGPAGPPDLALARQLADAGRLADALAVCQRCVTAAPSADGYALLGVVLHAGGDHGPAADAVRRALDRDPDHREALALAAGLSQAAGDAGRAGALRARLARLPAGGGS